MVSACTRSAATAEIRTVHIARLEEVRSARRYLRTHLPKSRQVVENPERAAMRSRDEVAFLHRKVVNRNDGQIPAERLPRISVVEAHPHPALRSGIQESATDRILTYDAHELGRSDSVGDELPRRAVVGRSVDVRTQVIHLEMIRRDERRARREVRSFDDGDAAPLRDVLRSDVLPGPPVVAGHM